MIEGLWQYPVLSRVFKQHRAAGIDHETSLLIGAQRLWVIKGGGVQTEAMERPRPRLVDCRLQQVGAEAAADKLGDEPEIAELRLERRGGVELEKAGRHTAHVENEDLDRRFEDLRRERPVVEEAPFEPEPGLANGVVEVAVERDSAVFGPHQR